MSRSFGGTVFTTRPPMAIVPSVMLSRPATIRSAVVFPQPDGPTSTMNSPSWMSRLSSEMAFDAAPVHLRDALEHDLGHAPPPEPGRGDHSIARVTVESNPPSGLRSAMATSIARCRCVTRGYVRPAECSRATRSIRSAAFVFPSR